MTTSEGPLRSIIVGASGLIGSGLESAAHSAWHHVVGTYSTRGRPGLVPFDLACDRLGDLVRDLAPNDAVVLMAAQIDQAWIVGHAEEARRSNVEGAIACAKATFERGAHFVFMSTEAVFGTGREEDFDESALPAPLSPHAANSSARDLMSRTRSACQPPSG